MIIHCTKLTKTKLFYLCPFCSSYKLKNGKDRKKPKLVFHNHGNPNGDMNNRSEFRCSHCVSGGEVEIVINDDTQKII